jgi:hypothetical protein
VGGPAPSRAERRSSSRISIPLELELERLGSDGQPVQHERTLAENFGRGGAQVFTAMSSLAIGEIVRLTELGGDFQTRAAVRSTYIASDRIRRLNVEFLDREAPDRLLPSEAASTGGFRQVQSSLSHPKMPAASAGTPQPVPASARGGSRTPMPTPVPRSSAALPAAGRQEVLERFASLKARNHHEVLGLARGASEVDVREAYMGLVRRFHPDSVQAGSASGLQAELGTILARVAEAYHVLVDPGRRASYEAFLGPERAPKTPQPTTPAPSRAGLAPGATPAPEPPQAEPSDTPSRQLESVEPVLRSAHALFKQEQYWDAIQQLEAAVPLAPSPIQRRLVQVLLARVMLKNPKWLRRAEDLLLLVTGEDPRNVVALLLLAGIYRAKGLHTRAERLLRQVLVLDPLNATAAKRLKELTASH